MSHMLFIFVYIISLKTRNYIRQVPAAVIIENYIV